jgi:hypothetical protein
MNRSIGISLKLLLGISLLMSVGCAMPVLVPTAIPLPSPSPTWTLLPAASPTRTASMTPETVSTASPEPPALPTATGTATAFSCPYAPTPRVVVGDDARVTFTDGLPLRIRETPQVANNNVVTQITEGAVFTIIGGPVCTPIPNTESAFVFWEIETEATGLTGWVAEGDESAYYIEKVP